MLVRAYFDTIMHASIKDELSVFLESFTTFLILIFWVLRRLEDA